MVKVRADYPLTDTGQVDINQWAERIISISGGNDFAQQQLTAADLPFGFWWYLCFWNQRHPFWSGYYDADHYHPLYLPA